MSCYHQRGRSRAGQEGHRGHRKIQIQRVKFSESHCNSEATLGIYLKYIVISLKYIYNIYIYGSIICVLVLVVFIFSCFLWKISAQDIEQNLEFIGEVRDAVYFQGTCLGNSGACARPRKRSAWKRCWWVRSRPLLFMSQWGKKVTFIITLCFFRLFCVESSLSTIFLWTLTTEGLCEPKEGRGCAVQVAS